MPTLIEFVPDACRAQCVLNADGRADPLLYRAMSGRQMGGHTGTGVNATTGGNGARTVAMC